MPDELLAALEQARGPRGARGLRVSGARRRAAAKNAEPAPPLFVATSVATSGARGREKHRGDARGASRATKTRVSPVRAQYAPPPTGSPSSPSTLDAAFR